MLRKWLYEYADSFYTWVVRHYVLSASQASDRTVQLLQTLYSKIGEYEPSQGSMYLWLLEQAAALLAPEKRWDPLQQMPGAAAIGQSLARIRTNDLPQEYLENPLVVHLVQASLSELEEAHRQILLFRYYRIEAEKTAWLEPVPSPEGLEENLVRARYYFRRSLLTWLQRLVPALPEVPADIRIDVFEKNLEKIFRSVPPLLNLPQESRQALEEALLQEAQFKRSSFRTRSVLSKPLIWGVCGGLFLGVLLIGFWGRSKSHEKETVSHAPAFPSPGTAGVKAAENKKDTVEDLRSILNQVFAAGSAGDVAELLEILRSGPYPAQVASAVFLGRVGDASVISSLEEASRRWFSTASAEDPFLQAIEQIEQRLRGAVETQEIITEVVLLEPNTQTPLGVGTEGQTPPLDSQIGEPPQEAAPQEASEEDANTLQADYEHGETIEQPVLELEGEPNQPAEWITGEYEQEPDDSALNEESEYEENQTDDVQYEW